MTRRSVRVLGGFLAITLIGGAPLAFAAGPKACSATTSAAFDACKTAAASDASLAEGACRNQPVKEALRACLSDARAAAREAMQQCKDQRGARRDVCDSLGEGPYAPSFLPADFESDFGALTHPNPLFPLGIGNTWTYAGGGEIERIPSTAPSFS